MGGFQVDPELLHEHAERLRVVGEGVGEAASAASSINLSGDAFGVMCAWLPPIVGRLEPSCAEAITAAAKSVAATAGGVDTMAKTYREAEDATVAAIHKILAQAVHRVPAR